MIPTTREAYQLLHDGAVALSRVEHNGIRVDVGYLTTTIKKTEQDIANLKKELNSDKVLKVWNRRFGTKTNIGSREQLGKVIFEDLGYPCENKTPTGRPKTDIEALETVDLPFVKRYVRLEKLKKAKGTYLEGILRETVDGFLHPSFNLNTVRTFRSSSSDPNFQNIPIRDPEIGRLIRTAFIPRRNHVLVEIDLKGNEVGTAACYNKDKKLIEYIKDKTKDMHRDMAMECYRLKEKQVSKAARNVAKACFVFAQFYGDYYVHSARGLWDAIGREGLQTTDGVSLREHLASKGITELGACDPDQRPVKGTFEHHIKEVENKFWNERFRGYTAWKKRWYEAYLECGEYTMLTGFREVGWFSRNDVWNWPVQGSAFHCLLWDLIQLSRRISKLKMGSKIVGQIHDSIEADVPKHEEQDYLQLAKQIMTVDLLKAWDWIIVPMSIEAESSAVNWFEKKKVEV